MEAKFYTGKLKRWNDDKGFGFNKSQKERKDIFSHISALKHMSRRPIVGDIIHFQVHIDNDGKNRAVNAKMEGIAVKKVSANKRKKEKKSTQ